MDTLAVHCEDGWLSLIPLSAVARNPGAVLAISETGHAVAAPRGPVFLAFPRTARAPDPKDKAAWADYDLIGENGYAWQVASLEYIKYKDFVARLAAAAPKADLRGRDVFASQCVHCHAVRGVGGAEGPDLARPALFSYRDEPRVRGYLRSPREINPQGRMPSFAGKLDDKTLERLIAWLKALTP